MPNNPSSTIHYPSIGLFPEEISIVTPKSAPSIVEWAPNHLVIPAKESPNLSGYFDWTFSPHLKEPCHWFNDPYVRQITIMAGLQRGKSLYMMLCAAWAMVWDPGPMMFVMADENTLRRRMKRFRPFFEANPPLLEKLRGKVDNLFLGEPSDLGDMLLLLGWASSAALLSDYPIRYEFLDEMVLWTAKLQGLSLDPMSLLRGRQNTFPDDSKTVIASSAGNVGELLDIEFEEGDKCEYWIKCPHCDWPQIPVWENVILDKDKSGDFLPIKDYIQGRHARYICPSCGAFWHDYDRAHAMQDGVWLPEGVTMDRHGKVCGKIKPTPYKSARIRSVMVHPRIGSIGKMAGDYVRAQKKLKNKDTSALKYFWNNHEAKSWQDERAATDMDTLKNHRGTYRTGQVPWGVQIITVAFDVHLDWFRVMVVGWGYLFEGWVLETIRVETTDTKEELAFEPLTGHLVKPWPLANGKWLRPSAVVIDMGYNTETVKNFCRRYRASVHRGQLIPIRGTPQRMTKHYKKMNEDSSMAVYEINTLLYKDQLYRQLYESETPGGGYLHLPHDTPGDVLGELCSEHRVIKNNYPTWAPKKEGLANHSWDVLGYNLFAAHLVQVGALSPLPEEPPIVKSQGNRNKRSQDNDRDYLSGLPAIEI